MCVLSAKLQISWNPKRVIARRKSATFFCGAKQEELTVRRIRVAMAGSHSIASSRSSAPVVGSVATLMIRNATSGKDETSPMLANSRWTRASPVASVTLRTAAYFAGWLFRRSFRGSLSWTR